MKLSVQQQESYCHRIAPDSEICVSMQRAGTSRIYNCEGYVVEKASGLSGSVLIVKFVYNNLVSGRPQILTRVPFDNPEIEVSDIAPTVAVSLPWEEIIVLDVWNPRTYRPFLEQNPDKKANLLQGYDRAFTSWMTRPGIGLAAPHAGEFDDLTTSFRAFSDLLSRSTGDLVRIFETLLGALAKLMLKILYRRPGAALRLFDQYEQERLSRHKYNECPYTSLVRIQTDRVFNSTREGKARNAQSTPDEQRRKGSRTSIRKGGQGQQQRVERETMVRPSSSHSQRSHTRGKSDLDGDAEREKYVAMRYSADLVRRGHRDRKQQMPMSPDNQKHSGRQDRQKDESADVSRTHESRVQAVWDAQAPDRRSQRRKEMVRENHRIQRLMQRQRSAQWRAEKKDRYRRPEPQQYRRLEDHKKKSLPFSCRKCNKRERIRTWIDSVPSFGSFTSSASANPPPMSPTPRVEWRRPPQAPAFRALTTRSPKTPLEGAQLVTEHTPPSPVCVLSGLESGRSKTSVKCHTLVVYADSDGGRDYGRGDPQSSPLQAPLPVCGDSKPPPERCTFIRAIETKSTRSDSLNDCRRQHSSSRCSAKSKRKGDQHRTVSHRRQDRQHDTHLQSTEAPATYLRSRDLYIGTTEVLVRASSGAITADLPLSWIWTTVGANTTPTMWTLLSVTLPSHDGEVESCTLETPIAPESTSRDPQQQQRLPTTTPQFPWAPDSIHPFPRYEGGPCIHIHGYGELSVDGIHRPTERDNNLTMAKTTTNLIDLELLAADSEVLREALLPIMDLDAFEKLYVDDLAARQTPKRRISRGMLKHLPTLLECDLVTICENDGKGTGDYMVCFLVPKKDGTGRYITNCRPINLVQERPPAMGLPAIKNVIEMILSWNYASQCDGTSFFYQFGLNPEIAEKYFKCRLADMRGKIVSVIQRRMSMGWATACCTAQAVANYIMADIGVGWVDNFIYGALTVEEFEKKRALLRERLQRYNIQVDDLEMEMSQSLFCLGLEFDLSKHQYRLDPKWVDKRSETFALAAKLDELTYRQVFELFGSLIWASYVRDEPLWMHAESLAALSQLAKTVNNQWDNKCEVPKYAYGDIAQWVQDITRNCWCTSPLSTTETGTSSRRGGLGDREPRVFSDASDIGAAWVRVMENSIVAGQQWHRGPGDGNIFIGELDAFLEAYKVFRTTESYAVDNLGLRLAVKKGHSSSYEANCKLRLECGRDRPVLWWVRTDLNISDPFSRRVGLPPLPAPVSDWVVYDDESGVKLSESSKIKSDFPLFPLWSKLKDVDKV